MFRFLSLNLDLERRIKMKVTKIIFLLVSFFALTRVYNSEICAQDYSIYSGEWTAVVDTTSASNPGDIGRNILKVILEVSPDGYVSGYYLPPTPCGSSISGFFSGNVVTTTGNNDYWHRTSDGKVVESCCTGTINITLTFLSSNYASGTFQAYSCLTTEPDGYRAGTITLWRCCDSANAEWHEIEFPNVHWWEPPRVLNIIEADSGERIELRWSDWGTRGYYRLDYYSPWGKIGRVGQCHFIHGCNIGKFFAPDNNQNGKPDCFLLIVWDSWDYGDDDDKDGYLDRYRHVYDVCRDKYSRSHFKYEYVCGPPVSSYPNFCKSFCGDPPALSPNPVYWQIVDPALGPESEALFDELLLELEKFDPTEIVMGRCLVHHLCDMDLDGDCDLMDYHIVENAIGMCLNEDSYNLLADIDGDGCVTESDLKLLFPTIPGDLDGDGDIDRNDLNILLTYRNQPASECPECDIDGDGIITVLDARKLVLMCTRPRCATE